MKVLAKIKTAKYKTAQAIVLILPILLLIGQTTPNFDLTPIIQVVIAVIPIFVIMLVVKLIFSSLKNVGD